MYNSSTVFSPEVSSVDTRETPLQAGRSLAKAGFKHLWFEIASTSQRVAANQIAVKMGGRPLEGAPCLGFSF